MRWLQMANCSSEEKYSKGGRCCNRCPAGKYVKADCDGSQQTQCAECGKGLYTATKNHLNQCRVCSKCSSQNNQRELTVCTATQNTVCTCEEGFFCLNEQCDHCKPVTQCREGEGVKIRANRTSDTVCAPCETGTYSNVTDFISSCKPHIRCEDFGNELTTPGTTTSNAVCGERIHHCSWMLPAALWSGLVLTALVMLAVVICWGGQTQINASHKGRPTVPVNLVDVVHVAHRTSLELPLPAIEQNGHCQETCAAEDCTLPLFNTDDNSVSFSTDSSLPITPFQVSVSFAESGHHKGSSGCRRGSFLRAHSEPQEDEWCGT
ncbi:tumor necrosis factor receptor superfamily member 5 [Echeneis naucrates]|uniref:tumor necrosis factor receptor superfamily member 5 n=1 Tax=Echeneis naucrates TaxID=173247 RepID=UPI001113441B|nr:tumor necrosis factor receptor superfamily member 5-like [Echeneis naucrates]